MNIAKRILQPIKNKCLVIQNRNLRPAFSIRSHMTVEERLALYRLATGKSSIAEIGSYIGASSCCFGEAIKNNGSGSLICIDTWNNDAMSEGSFDTWEEFEKNTQGYQQYIVPVRGYSTEVSEEVRKVSPILELLFIDGDHSYEGVKADWEEYKSFLSEGSVVIFHDYEWAEGVQRVVQEDVMPIVRSHSSLPNMWWAELGQKP